MLCHLRDRMHLKKTIFEGSNCESTYSAFCSVS